MIAAAKPAGIVVREKDLMIEDYEVFFERSVSICNEYEVPCIAHSFHDIAMEFNKKSIHVPLHVLSDFSTVIKSNFDVIGASCHSVEDALEAQKLGATYITAGHVFETDCKKGLPPRGLDFLREVCSAVNIPVYAIGGISPENFRTVLDAGAEGACVMSGIMTCDDPKAYLDRFREEIIK